MVSASVSEEDQRCEREGDERHRQESRRRSRSRTTTGIDHEEQGGPAGPNQDTVESASSLRSPAGPEGRVTRTVECDPGLVDDATLVEPRLRGEESTTKAPVSATRNGQLGIARRRAHAGRRAASARARRRTATRYGRRGTPDMSTRSNAAAQQLCGDRGDLRGRLAGRPSLRALRRASRSRRG